MTDGVIGWMSWYACDECAHQIEGDCEYDGPTEMDHYSDSVLCLDFKKRGDLA